VSSTTVCRGERLSRNTGSFLRSDVWQQQCDHAYVRQMPDVSTREGFDQLRAQVDALRDEFELLQSSPPELEAAEVRLTKAEIDAVLVSIFTESNVYHDPTDLGRPDSQP
jgi:hypothetical protein